jgi:hypothetical protein
MPFWPDESEALATDWIQLGKDFAEKLCLWQSSLRNAPECTKFVLDQLLQHLADSRLLCSWDRWLATVIRSAIERETHSDNWMFTATPESSILMTHVQLLGAVLYVARNQGWPTQPAAFLCLLNSKRNEPEQVLILISALIEASFAAVLNDVHGQAVDQDSWLSEFKLNQDIIALLQLTHECLGSDQPSERFDQYWTSLQDKFRDTCNSNHNRSESNQLLQVVRCLDLEAGLNLIYAGRMLDGHQVIEEVVQHSRIICPEGTNQDGWREVLINSVVSLTRQEDCKLLLIESKSLPRSGHHFLKDALSAILTEDFSYCSFYQEPGCCKVTPCNAEPYWYRPRRQGGAHTRLIKSHDFNLQDSQYALPPTVIRIIQVRQPFDLLASWLELEQLNRNQSLLQQHGISLNRIWLYHEKALLETAFALVDGEGEVMEAAEAKEWLLQKCTYIIDFTRKWLPLCQPFSELGELGNSTYVMRYEDLEDDLYRLVAYINKAHHDRSVFHTVPKFSPRSNVILQRRSSLISNLLQELLSELRHVEEVVLAEWSRWKELSFYEARKI